MKLTRDHIRSLIKEELKRALIKEDDLSQWGEPSGGGAPASLPASGGTAAMAAPEPEVGGVPVPETEPVAEAQLVSWLSDTSSELLGVQQSNEINTAGKNLKYNLVFKDAGNNQWSYELTPAGQPEHEELTAELRTLIDRDFKPSGGETTRTGRVIGSPEHSELSSALEAYANMGYSEIPTEFQAGSSEYAGSTSYDMPGLQESKSYGSKTHETGLLMESWRSYLNEDTDK